MFLSFPETNLGSAEKASVKDEDRLLTDCAYKALMLWVCMFLNFHNAPVPQRLIAKECLLSLTSLSLEKVHCHTCFDLHVII